MTKPASAAAGRTVLDVVVRAPAEASFAALTEWSAQEQWLPGTRVRVTQGDGASVGSRLEATVGRGPAAIVDAFVIVDWDPPHRLQVRHEGPVVRGTGCLDVLELPRGMSRVVWTEERELPLGAVGRLGWSLARPAWTAGVRRSLRAFARLVETGVLPSPTAPDAPGTEGGQPAVPLGDRERP